ncbi:hypothetical protein AB0M87_26675 [Streptomyces sp. NPDC051320]|uniref:hypothetical protein n=1 Tax=Streptomyces sp. NPDC051320 TaxID=3154644 RepID=UPI003424094F
MGGFDVQVFSAGRGRCRRGPGRALRFLRHDAEGRGVGRYGGRLARLVLGAREAAAASVPSSAPVPVTAEKVRDAFAGLQATLRDSCTPGNCAYFLGRVYDELHRTDRAMKADPQGPGHFSEPIALIKKLDAQLGGDRSFENLKSHQDALIGTRDTINTWMQGHPEDYR